MYLHLHLPHLARNLVFAMGSGLAERYDSPFANTFPRPKVLENVFLVLAGYSALYGVD